MYIASSKAYFNGDTMELIEIYEAVQAVKQVVDVIDDNTNGQLIPQEVTDVLKTFGDGSEISEPNNDIEVLLTDIKNCLMTTYTDGTETVTMTAAQRLDIIDDRLNSEFITVNDCLGLMATCMLTFFAFKVITWFYNLLSN